MPTRFLYLAGFLVIAGLLSYGVYLQVFDGFQPCPLCTLQRICFGLVGIVFLIGFLFHRSRFCCLTTSILSILFSFLGLLFSGRQIWLQLYPSAGSSECGVSLRYMMQVLPWNEVAKKIIAGTAECSQRTWEFLTFSMAEWSAICFTGLLLLSVYLFRRASS